VLFAALDVTIFTLRSVVNYAYLADEKKPAEAGLAGRSLIHFVLIAVPDAVAMSIYPPLSPISVKE
jgi:hypothetical protein